MTTVPIILWERSVNCVRLTSLVSRVVGLVLLVTVLQSTLRIYSAMKRVCALVSLVLVEQSVWNVRISSTT